MSVKIKPITDHKIYEVNGKTVSKNQNGNWKYEDDLTHKEILAFDQYENIVIKNPIFKKHTKAIYMG